MTLSVVVPGFNTPEKWWRRCVESLLAAGADEIICVDDGSEVKPAFLETYPVRVIYIKENGGQAAARNVAIDAATCDYVTFVDSDDEVEPDTFMRCKARLLETQADIAVYGARVIWPDDGLMKIDMPTRRIDGRVLTPEEVRWLSESCLFHYPCNKVYLRSFLNGHKIRFEKQGMPCEDIIFNLETLLAQARFCTVDFAGYVYYRTRGTSLSRYKTSSDVGTRQVSGMWRKYKQSMPGAQDALGSYGEISEAQLAQTAWRNVWMPGTPYSLLQRWRMRPGKAFFKMLVFMFLRRHFYFRPIRRWNTRRNYPHAVEWCGRCR